jgi:signal transduction histidine kinase/CheY-like chemotaxis protein
VIDAPWDVTLSMTGLVALTALPGLILWTTARRNLAGFSLATLGLLACGSLAWLHGGIQSPVTLSLGLVPMTAIVVCNRREAMIVWAMTTATLLSLFFASRHGVLPPSIEQDPARLDSLWLWNHFCFQLLSVAVAGLLESVAERMFAGLGKANQRLDAALQAARTAQAEAEAARREAERMAEVRGHFLANMSHEVRTPMNGVLGMADLLLASPLSKEQQSYTWTIAQAARALVAVLDDVLDFSKLEAGKIRLEQVPFTVRELSAGVTRLLANDAASKGIALHSSVDAEVPERLLGDPTRVRQILYNLVGNAIKFTDRGDVSVRLRYAQRALMIEVRDTGVGIASDKLDSIFDAFTQADASTTRQFGGTGLGLTISRELARTMGGDLRVESTLGVGSTFTADLPLAPTEEAEPDTSPNAVPTTDRALRVLVAEDNPVNQTVVARMLERLGHAATIVPDGEVALDAWRAGGFDIVLMDWQMPRLDGLEATRRLRAAERAEGRARLPVLAMTANVLSGDRERCLEAGMDDLLGKPVTLVQLRGALAAWARPPAPGAPVARP